VEKKYPIGYITINRPQKRNSLSFGPTGTQAQIIQACDDFKEDPQIRVFIIKGARPCFCSGFDLGSAEFTKEMPDDALVKGREHEVWPRFFHGQKGVENPESILPEGGGWWWQSLWKNPKPSIALVHSFCFGAGLYTANFCDIVYATPDALFGYPPVRFGCPITMAILQPWLLGPRLTRWMALTGWSIGAEEALSHGLITKIVPKERAEQEVDKLAMAIAKVPPLTNVFTKWSINNYYESQGIKQHIENSGAGTMIIEQSTLPGGNWDYVKMVEEYGLKEAQRIQFEKYGAVDELQERERQKIKAEYKKPKV
jgi:enoyl-CoA hydratase/carnithine racemase